MAVLADTRWGGSGMGKQRFAGLHNIHLIIQIMFFKMEFDNKVNDWSHTFQDKTGGEWMAPTVEALHGTK